MNRIELNEHIHELLGWKKVPHDKDYQCPNGYAWQSPEGMLYEGGVHMVPDYIKQIADTAALLSKLTEKVQGEHPQGVS